MEFTREMESLTEQRYGRFIARLSLACWVALPIGAVIGGLVVGVTWIKNHVVTRLPSANQVPQPSSYTDIALSIAIMVGLLGIGAYILRRWFRRWEKALHQSLDNRFTETIVPRFKHLEENGVDLATANQSMIALMDRVRSIEVALGADRDAAMKSLMGRDYTDPKYKPTTLGNLGKPRQ